MASRILVAYLQVQSNIYGSTILAATQVFFDRRLERPGSAALFYQLELLGENAARVFAELDAGIWELRGSAHVHTFSSVMCCVACDRLAKIAERLGLQERLRYWRWHVDRIHQVIATHAWNERHGTFVASFEGDSLDASVVMLAELGFVQPDDPRFAATVGAIERDLREGNFVFRYREADDFGVSGQHVHRMHVLVHRRAGRAGTARRGAGAVRNHARVPQSPWAAR